MYFLLLEAYTLSQPSLFTYGHIPISTRKLQRGSAARPVHVRSSQLSYILVGVEFAINLEISPLK